MSDPPLVHPPISLENSSAFSIAIKVTISIYDFVSTAFSGAMCIRWIFGEDAVVASVVGVSIYTAITARVKMENIAATALVEIQLTMGVTAPILSWRGKNPQRSGITREARVLGWMLSLVSDA